MAHFLQRSPTHISNPKEERFMTQTLHTILPADSHQALQAILSATSSVLDALNQEAGAIARNDGFAFSILQEEKEALIRRYTQASIEFRTRIEEFKNTDATVLHKLYALQEEIKNTAQANNAALSPIVEKAKKQRKGDV